MCKSSRTGLYRDKAGDIGDAKCYKCVCGTATGYTKV